MRLRPTSDVPERFRGVFADFSHFNIVQSTVFDDLVLGSAAAVVVSAPTGSGKTVLFELAIVRALEESGVGVGRPTASSKLVYLSPMKSLCSERMRDWSSKFGPLGVRCLELTGDSPWEDVAAIRNYDLVLTTPEKWDVVTRRWKEHGDVARTVGLLMIDEVGDHILQVIDVYTQVLCIVFWGGWWWTGAPVERPVEGPHTRGNSQQGKNYSQDCRFPTTRGC